MTTDERICSIALSLLFKSNKSGARRLVREVGSAARVFEMRESLPDIVPDIQSKTLELVRNCAEAFKRAEQEMVFAEKKGIACLTYTDEAYPSRLRECEDAPVALFFKGHMDFNRPHIVSVVGTRRTTGYGKEMCRSLVSGLAAACPDIVVVSGLAYGADIHAHRAAIDNNVPTVAILAHGLDRIYPSVHRNTAVRMIENGGLLTEFLTGTEPERYNFISRNRIVAGMSDATIVIESAIKGGSLITADLANGYNRDCFAVPGRATDELSAGCNLLIRDNKAALVNSAADFLKAMGWASESGNHAAADTQLPLFPELDEDEKRIVQLLHERGDLQLDTLVVASNIPAGRIHPLLFSLEMKGIVKLMVGGMYHLIHSMR